MKLRPITHSNERHECHYHYNYNGLHINRTGFKMESPMGARQNPWNRLKHKERNKCTYVRVVRVPFPPTRTATVPSRGNRVPAAAVVVVKRWLLLPQLSHLNRVSCSLANVCGLRILPFLFLSILSSCPYYLSFLQLSRCNYFSWGINPIHV